MDFKGTELNYTAQEIKKITPYLDGIVRIHGNKKTVENPDCIGSKQPLNDNERAAAWYYTFNGHNKSQAYLLAYFPKWDEENEELIVDQEARQKKHKRNKNANVKAYKMFNRLIIKDAVKAISEEIIKNIKLESKQTIIEQLYIQATYDPKMFYTPKGEIKFKDWDEIPEKYRCCVADIEKKFFGKDASVEQIKITLVDRNQARKQLMNICPGLLSTTKTEMLHKTVDDEGNEKGINPYSSYSTQELEEKLQELMSKEDKNGEGN